MQLSEKQLKIIGIVTFALLLFGVILYQKWQITDSGEDIVIEKETETYSNEYFSIEYPKTMKISEFDVGSPPNAGRGISFALIGPTQSEGTELYDGIGFSIAQRKLDENETLEEFVKREIKAVENTGKIIDPVKNIIIARRNGFAFTEDSLGVFKRIFIPWNERRSNEAFEIAILTPDPKNSGYRGIAADMLESLAFKDEVSDKIDIEVFFSNERVSGKNAPCEKVVPVTRTVNRRAPLVLTALEELVKGPSEEEKQKGYFTSLNSGIDILNLVIERGEALIDFNESLNRGVAGSCRVIAIGAQIEETIKQFAHLTTAVISVRGETEGILEP